MRNDTLHGLLAELEHARARRSDDRTIDALRLDVLAMLDRIDPPPSQRLAALLRSPLFDAQFDRALDALGASARSFPPDDADALLHGFVERLGETHEWAADRLERLLLGGLLARARQVALGHAVCRLAEQEYGRSALLRLVLRRDDWPSRKLSIGARTARAFRDDEGGLGALKPVISPDGRAHLWRLAVSTGDDPLIRRLARVGLPWRPADHEVFRSSLHRGQLDPRLRLTALGRIVVEAQSAEAVQAAMQRLAE